MIEKRNDIYISSNWRQRVWLRIDRVMRKLLWKRRYTFSYGIVTQEEVER
jgi:hypothetical protein